jgi:membrane protein DedA with SNARE-associated domain
MGGAVAVELADRAPDRVASVVMVACIGVQELELFGDYRLNHAVHGLQLAAVQAARWGLPHFGAMDDFALGLPYARNFYDTDQRPLRNMLRRLRQPLLLVHGERDFLVPVAAAREHHRIVPHSELQVLDDGHFVVFTRPGDLAERIDTWVKRVPTDPALRPENASRDRLLAAAEPFDPSTIPPAGGPTLLVLFLLLAAATLVSEDLTCIAAGLLVAQGRMTFVPAVAACLFGILLGDVLLFLAGRWLGRPAVKRAPLSWFVSEDGVDRASAWFRQRGMAVIFLSRFLPGLRLPTYFAAGVLKTRLLVFTGYFLLAGLLWTPALVGFAAVAGKAAGDVFHLFERWSLPVGLALVLFIYLVQRLVLPAFSHRGRRLLLGRWRRLTRWEFWPPWALYPPVVLRILGHALRHRSLSVVTAVNPAIPAGGFIGESKAGILDGLGDHPEVARFRLLRATWSGEGRRTAAASFMEENGLEFPVVLKPDVGQRGSGVLIPYTAEELNRALESVAVDMVLQEHVPGIEVGVFWLREPGQENGRIFSVTEKRMPSVTGDGVRDLETLILDDDRAVCMAETHLARHASRLRDVPPAGETISLVQLGTHCRGAVFLDGQRLATPALAAAMDRIASRYEGFHFGRFDLRAPDLDAVAEGRNLRVIEVNGLTSEATHIYDPGLSLFNAWSVLSEQWRLAYAIGSANAEAGSATTGLGTLLVETWRYGRLHGRHPASAQAR